MDLRHKYRGSIERLWPRRLLDIATMTSYERQVGNVYGGVRDPHYSVVSYTWGRYRVLEDTAIPRIGINGITWPLPCVDPNYFSADDFLRMLLQVRAITGNRFIWIDVACVDTEDLSVRMDETWTAMTPGIFANASAAFVWLITVPTFVLRKSWDYWQTLLSHQSYNTNMTEDLNSMLDLEEAVLTLLGEVWFTAGWTLQEQSIRKDAFIMSREGDIAGTDIMPCNINSLQLGWGILSSSSSKMPRGPPNTPIRDIDIVNERIRQYILKATFLQPMGSNPNMYYAMAHERTHVRQEDHIYGALGLYSRQVGNALKAREEYLEASSPTFDELEERFAIALNKHSMFLGQLFIHSDMPSTGKTWKITQRNARVPEGFDDWTPKHITDNCILDVCPDGAAYITANIASFESLIDFWEARILNLDSVQRKDQLLVVVDDYLCQGQTAIPSHDFKALAFRNDTDIFHRNEATMRGLLATFDVRRLSILKLGGLSLRSGLFSECFGLLILHDEDDRNSCQRLGLCRWEGDDYFENNIPEEAKALMPRFDQRYHGVIH